jgi:Mce-associated membrane protein
VLSVDEESKIDDETGTAVDGAATDESRVTVVGHKLTKVEKLEAKAARLREAEQKARAERADFVVTDPAARRGGVARGWVVVAAVLGVLVVALGSLSAALLVMLNRSHHDLHTARQASSLDALRSSALLAAQQDAVDFSSFDYQNVQANSTKVAAHLTPSFAKSYLSATASLRTLIAQYKGKAVATVRGAAVSNVSTSGATVLLILDQSITTAQSATPRIDRYRAQMTLERQKDGTWLVSNLVLL